MAVRVLVFYGSYRSDRVGIRLADYVVAGLQARGGDVELIDAKAIGLPMLDRMFKEYAPGSAPAPLAVLATKISGFGCIRFRDRRIQLGHAARPEESDRSLP